ncbi:putative zinc metallopeptidase protein [Liberibacter crescens BT-1]|uniref:Zinc metalloprotease n=1 Tax=Liberibacter crescens (strain BT-1) TaxID=1215343 RepID=L0ERE1_LIBCB|nr:RIP metalloprotease RseP [Liberibacter crescens]AGA64039.1 putative zinc metallopeptidase protein [Liberibacter crescens BT-1]
MSFVLSYVIPFLSVIYLVVLVHEFGHYIAGRLCGIQAVVFSLGFGPEIFGFMSRSGVRWKFSAIPLGGYVRFLGGERSSHVQSASSVVKNSKDKGQNSFLGASLWKRSLVVVAGPLANFLMTAMIFTFLFYKNGIIIIDPIVSQIEPGSPAAEAGIKPGDLLVSVDGHQISSFQDVMLYVQSHPKKEMIFILKRQDKDFVKFAITPRMEKITNALGQKVSVPLIGLKVYSVKSKHQFLTLPEAFFMGLYEIHDIVKATLQYFYNVLSGQMKSDQITGPIGVAKIAKHMSDIGFEALVRFLAFISLSVGLINLMPIPILDGGHLMLYFLEAVRGKPLGELSEKIVLQIGLILVLVLTVVATRNDVSGLINSFKQ